MADTTQTLTPTSGTDGRVKLHGSPPTRLAGISEWKRQSKTTAMPFPHFESGANTDGLVQPGKLRGLGDTTVAITGWYNINVTDQTEIGTTGLDNGVYVALDLVVSKDIATGYSNVPGWITNFETGQKIDNQVCMFTATLDVDGVFPSYGPVV